MADTQAAKDYPAVFKQMVEDGGYSCHQIFNGDETNLFWKHAPKTTVTWKDEKQARGVKPSKECLSVLLTCNAAGDFTCNAASDHKLKPLVVARAPRPWAYKHVDMLHLYVYWTNNKKTWVTSSILPDWFDNHFCA